MELVHIPRYSLNEMSLQRNSLPDRVRNRTLEPIGRMGAPTQCESAALTPFLRKNRQVQPMLLVLILYTEKPKGPMLDQLVSQIFPLISQLLSI